MHSENHMPIKDVINKLQLIFIARSDIPPYDLFYHMMLVELLADSLELSSSSTESPYESL